VKEKERLIFEKGFSVVYILREVDCNNFRGLLQVRN